MKLNTLNEEFNNAIWNNNSVLVCANSPHLLTTFLAENINKYMKEKNDSMKVAYFDLVYNIDLFIRRYTVENLRADQLGKDRKKAILYFESFDMEEIVKDFYEKIKNDPLLKYVIIDDINIAIESGVLIGKNKTDLIDLYEELLRDIKKNNRVCITCCNELETELDCLHETTLRMILE